MDTQQVKPVVVGVDGSATATRAVRWGAVEARRRKVPLRLVTATGRQVDPDPGHPRPGDDYRQVVLDRARAHLVAAAAAAQQEAPGLETEQRCVEGTPISVLVAESAPGGLVVIGDHGWSRIEGVLLGSVAIALAVHAAGPVVVVRGTTRKSAALPVLVGLDGSATAEATIAFAFEAAAARGVPLVALHTWSDVVFDPSIEAVMTDWGMLQRAEEGILATRIAGWAEKFPEVAVEQVVTRGTPAYWLIEYGERAQLVVVGSRGHSEFAALLLGSVSNALLHRSPCPVAIVRSGLDG